MPVSDHLHEFLGREAYPRRRPHGWRLASSRPRRPFVLPVSIEPSVFGWFDGAQHPPQSGPPS